MLVALLVISSAVLAVVLWTALGDPASAVTWAGYYIKRRKGSSDVIWLDGGFSAELIESIPKDPPGLREQFNLLAGMAASSPIPVLKDVYVCMQGDFRVVGEGPPIKLFLFGNEGEGARQRYRSHRADAVTIRRYVFKNQDYRAWEMMEKRRNGESPEEGQLKFD